MRSGQLDIRARKSIAPDGDVAIRTGNDLLLFANQQVYDATLVARVVKLVAAAVASGRIPRARIDEAYGRVQALFGKIGG